MILGKYIRQLLDEKKRVVLAGFGNLELKVPEGTQSPSGSRIEPPGISVRFDSSFSKDDGLLASIYAEGEGLDSDEAHQRVLELIDAIKFALDKGESYTLPDTGTFDRDDDSRVRFQVDTAWLLEPDQYGLETMDLLELEELQPEEEMVEAEKGATTAPAAVSPEPAREVTPLAPVEAKSKPRKWRLIWAVAGLLIVVLVVVIMIPAKENENGERTWKFLNRKPAQEVVDQEVITEGEEEATAGEQVPAEETEIPLTPRETVEPIPVEVSNAYFIIAGSFKNLGNASDLQDQLKRKGYDAEVMITENRMYRVSVTSFATKGEAEKGLAEFKKKPGLESCWLLSN